MGRRWLAGSTGLVALAGAAVTGVALAGSPARPEPAAAASRTTRTVTLVTGDRVTVSGNGTSVSAQAGAGRTGTVFSIASNHGHVRVVPSDAGPLLAAGRLDPRLFDVTGLLAAGYDRRDYLPLILVGNGVAGLATRATLSVMHGTAVRQPRDQAARTWKAMTASAGSKIWLDATLHPALDAGVTRIGAPAAWSAGYTGTGVRVAVLDTGIDDTHPDLAGAVVARRNFADGEPDADTVGHGTHVAATIAGHGDRYRGVAPDARLLDGKVCGTGGCLESSILAGMTWAAADEHAKIVNLSLGGEDDPAVTDRSRQRSRRSAPSTAPCSSSPPATPTDRWCTGPSTRPVRRPRRSPWARSTGTTGSPASRCAARPRTDA